MENRREGRRDDFRGARQDPSALDERALRRDAGDAEIGAGIGRGEGERVGRERPARIDLELGPGSAFPGGGVGV